MFYSYITFFDRHTHFAFFSLSLALSSLSVFNNTVDEYLFSGRYVSIIDQSQPNVLRTQRIVVSLAKNLRESVNEKIIIRSVRSTIHPIEMIADAIDIPS